MELDNSWAVTTQTSYNQDLSFYEPITMKCKSCGYEFSIPGLSTFVPMCKMCSSRNLAMKNITGWEWEDLCPVAK